MTLKCSIVYLNTSTCCCSRAYRFDDDAVDDADDAEDVVSFVDDDDQALLNHWTVPRAPQLRLPHSANFELFCDDADDDIDDTDSGLRCT